MNASGYISNLRTSESAMSGSGKTEQRHGDKVIPSFMIRAMMSIVEVS
jgi:hypothetical protein